MPPKKPHKNHTSKPPSSTRAKGKPHQPPPARSNKSETVTITPKESSATEQEILTIFRRTFSHAFTSTLSQTLQEVKGHLYNRDYLQAFGSEEYLQAYVVRWSPSRALAYRKIFLETCEEVTRVFDVNSNGANDSPAEVVCIGGGAGAEVVGIAATVKELVGNRVGSGKETSSSPEQYDKMGTMTGESTSMLNEPEGRSNSIQTASFSELRIFVIDIAPWTTIITSLVASLSQCSPSQEIPLISPDVFSATFDQADILSSHPASPINKSTSLITLLFTTNELFTQSTPKASSFLSGLADRLSSGALLLVVESAGNYSMVKVGEKEYPMPWLLDLILLGRPGDGDSGMWKKIVSEDSVWYRLPKGGLKYPIELENMRYLVRVYQRI